jgi:hypothetical protein
MLKKPAAQIVANVRSWRGERAFEFLCKLELHAIWFRYTLKWIVIDALFLAQLFNRVASAK